MPPKWKYAARKVSRNSQAEVPTNIVSNPKQLRTKQLFDDDDAISEFLKNLVHVVKHDTLQGPHLRPKPLRDVHRGLERATCYGIRAPTRYTLHFPLYG